MSPQFFRGVTTKKLLPIFVGAALFAPISFVQAQPQEPQTAPNQQQVPEFQKLLIAAGRADTAGHLDEAEDKYRQALELAPPDWKSQIRSLLGIFYVSHARFAEGAEEFKLIVADPAEPKESKLTAREFLGMAYSALNRHEAARAEYSTALAEGAVSLTDKENLRFSIAETYLLEQRYPEARQALNQFLALPNISESNSILARISLGLSHIGEGNYAAAIGNYQYVLDVPTPEKVSQRQMSITRFKQRAQLGLAQAHIGLALQSEQEVLKSKYLPAGTEAKARKQMEVLQKIQDDFLNQLRGISETKSAETPIKVGQLAPDFTLVDSNGVMQRLSDYRGKKQVLLTFFPKCFTGGCKNHLSTLRDAQDEFEADNVQILAISVDAAEGPQGQRAFAKEWGFEFPMLPDAQRKISMLYGAAQTPTDVSARMSVLVGTDGRIKIVDTKVNVLTHAADVLAKMKTLDLAG